MTIDERHRSGRDAPSSAEVRSLLAAAAAPTEPGPVPGEAGALAAFRAVTRARGRKRMLSTVTPLKATLAASATAGLLLTGGVSAAVAGALPGAAQDTARTMLARVGVTVPGADEASAGHADERGTSTDHDSAADASAGSRAGDSGKGGKVSDLARTTDATGVDKGAEVSGLASGGKSQAGRHGKAAAPDTTRSEDAGANGRADDHQPSVDASRAGDTGKADARATDDTTAPTRAGDHAQQQADQASGGRSASGTGNRP